MREIKFRVWDGDQMVSPDYIDRYGNAHWKSNSIPTTSKDLDQFTGLLDKFGKEIYEGDVIEVQNLPCQIQKARLIGEVTMSWAAWGVDIKEVVIWRGYSPGVQPSGRLFFLNIFDAMEIRIIGNVHENPELINQTPDGARRGE